MRMEIRSDRDLFQVRVALVRAFLVERGLDGVLLTRADNFAMATGGRRNYIWTYTDAGANALFVHRDGRVFFVGDTIEKPRIMAEELAGFGCDAVDYLWFASHPAEAVGRAFADAIASDDGSIGPNVHGELAVLRALLTPMELEKYRELGRRAAEAMTATLLDIRPGDRENDIAARLVYEGQRRECQVPVALIAADERIRFRHPLPSQGALLSAETGVTRVRGYVMVVGCFLKEGLVVSLTRFKRVGILPEGVADAYARICGVDAIAQEATRPGRTLGEVFDDLAAAYGRLGFAPDEWHNHHQGGSTGYAGRTCKGKPGETFPVLDTFWPERLKAHTGLEVPFGSAFAWNPSGGGAKSEDTFLLWPDGTKEIVSRTLALPTVNLEAVLGRPVDIVKSAMAE
ncbi:MAG TPA: aminopeptidase P family N-terminal domain-containing protein [Candidatus Hydrogenedentes bacterium]|nr:aminopeptidase P family N-terminal domain-containing protein [Candidatus Hydrogenedentota bacterium]